MLKRIVVENWKSLRRLELRLGRMNLFVGTNASGKSNFFDALRVLQGIGSGFTIHEILDGKPKSATSEVWDGIRGGSGKACFAGSGASLVSMTAQGEVAVDGATHEWSFEIAFDPLVGRVAREALDAGPIRYRDKSSPGGTADARFEIKLTSRADSNPLLACDRNRAALTQIPNFNGSVDPAQSKVAAAVARLLADMQRIDPSPVLLRTYSQAHRIQRLGERGENFAALVKTIIADAATKDAYLSWLRQLRPAEVDDVGTLEGAVGEPMFMLREGNREFPAPVLSDGTLRFAAITAALFQPDMPAMMLFEEIENGIHPSRLRLLVELLRSRSAQSRPQLMATTHSPTVLSWLDETEHATTFLCKREDDGSSRICALTDIPHFRDVVKKQPIADLLTEGWLEAAL